MTKHDERLKRIKDQHQARIKEIKRDRLEEEYQMGKKNKKNGKKKGKFTRFTDGIHKGISMLTRKTVKPAEYTLVIETLPFFKFHHYCNQVDGEISGFGKVVEDTKKKEIRLKDIRIFKQRISPASTVLDAAQLSEFICGIIQDGGDPYDWRFWWHSHYTMHAYFSTIDDATIAELSATGQLISLCTNKAGKFAVRRDVNAEQEDLFLKIDFGNNEKIKAQCEKDIKEHVKIDKPLIYTGKGGNNGFHKADRHLEHGFVEC